MEHVCKLLILSMKNLLFTFVVLCLLTGCESAQQKNSSIQQNSATNVSGSSSGGPTEGSK